jgi:hypothetical protein
MQITITIGDNTWTGNVTEENPVDQEGGSQQKNTQKNQQQEGGKRMKKEKKAKGTRKLSPYMKFAQQARVEILKENPSLKSDIIAVGRKIGEKWRALSDDEKAKY